MTRISTYAHHSQVVSVALNTQESVMNRQVQAASGYEDRVYTGISSDSQRVVNLETQVSRIDQYVKNGDTAELRLNTMENSVASLSDLASRYRTLLIQATSGNQADDVNLATEATAMLQTVQTTLNARLDGRYLFGGANTDAPPVDLGAISTPTQVFTETSVNSASSTLDTQGLSSSGNLIVNGVTIPYNITTDSLEDIANSINTNATLSAGGINAFIDQGTDNKFRLAIEEPNGGGLVVTEDSGAGGDLVSTLQIEEGLILRPDTGYYQGDQQQLETRLDDEFNLEYGVLADEGGFEALIRSLRVAEATTDRESLVEALDVLNTAITELPNIRSDIGVDLATTQQFETQQLDLKVFAEQAITELETVDIPETIALLSQEQTQLQAAYVTISRLSELSLTNYLR